MHDARVGLFGRYPMIEMRAILGVGDDIDLENLPAQVDAALGRMQATTGPPRPRPDHCPLQKRGPGAPARLEKPGAPGQVALAL